jgi:pimeloyl-ACP methyl ester carboxylesterase
MTNIKYLLLSILQLAMILAFVLISPVKTEAEIWTFAAFDPKGDGSDASLADAATLCYRYDKQQDKLWFRISLYGAPNEKTFGVNIAIDTGAAETAKMNWWGANKNFKFDRLLTAWVTRIGDRYEGMMGVNDAPVGREMQSKNAIRNNLDIRVEGDSIMIGVKRTDITDKVKMNLVAAVGSNEKWNDDVPNTGQASIDLAAERSTRGLRELDSTRNNFTFPATYKTLAAGKLPLISKKGQGSQALILIQGEYSGATSYDNFIAQNQSRYKLYVVTSPGINGTPARPMPPAGSSFAERPWTRRLELDLLELIRKEKIAKPIIVAESQPGSIAAMDIALEHPDQIGGVVISGTSLLQFFSSPKDPTRKTLATLAERTDLVDDAWAQKWFRYVTPETWESNDMRPVMLASDLAAGQKASREIEAAPLEVKIRYLCEFWAADVTRDLDKLQVPVLALVAGFDDKFLADPANTFTRMAYVDSWQTLVPKHPKLEIVKIPNARLLIFQDQPQAANDAMTRFIEGVKRAKS